MEHQVVRVGNHELANDKPLALIAGPCQMESLTHTLRMAESLAWMASNLNMPFIFKASFDKANRTSMNGQRGVGLEHGMFILHEVKKQVGCPVTTDVHTVAQAQTAASFGVDLLQIPAMLSRQTDLLVAAGETGRPVNIKKGQGMHGLAALQAAEKAQGIGGGVMLTERGTSFGYSDLVADMRNIRVMRSGGVPVIFDASHTTQHPGPTSTSGDRSMTPILARAAVAAGVAGVFIECHDNPDDAPSDGPSMMSLDDMDELLYMLQRIDEVVKSSPLTLS